MSKTTENDQENRPLSAYEAEQEARRERYEQRAEVAARRSDSRHDAARAQVKGIPFGQPTLVGHHSEVRHRRALAKHDNHMRAAIDEDKKAQYYAGKAVSVGTGGISTRIDAIEVRVEFCPLRPQPDLRKPVAVERILSKVRLHQSLKELPFLEF